MSKRILVVDDSRLNIKLLGEILESEGYTVYSTENGLSVREMAHNIKPDIILLDIVLPGMDGFEVCHILKNDFELKDIPVIMVTAKTNGADVKKALDLGAFDYIKKPVDEWEVIARVQSALRLKEYQDKLKEMAIKDSLTGIFNHGLLIELLDKEIAKQERKRYNLCFVMIDIDYFKRVNDTYGHATGDIILKELADILSSSVRKSDTIGRYGGEEFGFILPDISQTEACHLCERIRLNIENHCFNIDGKCVHITISIGICYKRAADPISHIDMVKAADDALYISKSKGRNRVEISSIKSKHV